jgi:hypothetical protein
MDLPFILNPPRISSLHPEDLVFRAIAGIGGLAQNEAIAAGNIAAARKVLSAESVPAWEKLMALEWLVAVIAGEKTIAHILDPFADRPLSDSEAIGLTARQLAETGAAVAVIPLASQNGDAAGLAALIISPGRPGLPSDQKSHWEGADEFEPLHNLRLDALTAIPAGSLKRIEGTSWQLGAALAAHALKRSPRARLALAADWLPTGKVAPDGSLKRVLEGNKPSLQIPNRRWLIPSEMPIPDALRRSGFAQASTLDNAWNIITHQGTVEEKAILEWPTDLETLHSFVSGAREPVIAAALLSNCNRLVLWCTDNEDLSRKPADDIQRILGRLRPDLKVDVQAIESDSMHRIEQTLENGLKTVLKAGQLTLFNVTQGNRLMGFAVHTLARRYPTLQLLYRDLDATGLDFTAIRYDGRDYPVTYTLSASEASHPTIQWKALLRPPTLRQREDWLELLKKITTKPETVTEKHS